MLTLRHYGNSEAVFASISCISLDFSYHIMAIILSNTVMIPRPVSGALCIMDVQ